MNEAPKKFTYFMARPGPRPPIWIRPAQWALLGAWLVFAHWICMGEGRTFIAGSFYNYCGVFTEEIVWKAAILPNLGLVSVALLALQIWLQVLWQRCRVSVEGAPGAWRWTGRRGPAAPERVARTPGGAWMFGGGRWWYLAHGFVGEGGEDFVAATGAPAVSLWHWIRFASPLAVLLIVLGASAWMLQRPIARERRIRNQAIRALWRGGDAEAMARSHPEIRPWVRYVQSQRGCDTAPCLHEQIISRLEGLHIGPVFSNEELNLRRLLILNGWPRLALKLFGSRNGRAAEIWVRLDRPREARLAMESSRKSGGPAPKETDILLLVEEGRLEEAWVLRESLTGPSGQRAALLRAVLAHLTGRCVEAEREARSLLTPHSFTQVSLLGKAPLTGMGGLQRAARDVRIHASCAAGLILLGQEASAVAEWETAERLADWAGLPGLLDEDRILLRRVARQGPWSAPPPPHRRPGSELGKVKSKK